MADQTVIRPEPWENPDPTGFHFEAFESQPWWRVAAPGDAHRCRWTVTQHVTCGNPSVAAIDRSSTKGLSRWWFYCAEHLYGRWIEDGKVMEWRLVKNDG